MGLSRVRQCDNDILVDFIFGVCLSLPYLHPRGFQLHISQMRIIKPWTLTLM